MHVRVCVCMGQGRLERVASGHVCIYMGEGDQIGEWVYVHGLGGNSQGEEVVRGGKLEGLCKLNYLVNW